MSSQLQTFVRPHVTEKGTNLQSSGQYIFKVPVIETKKSIKEAVEKSYNVLVASVNTVTMKGKIRRVGKTTGRRRDWKKAYVTLAQGHVINFSEEQPKE